MVKFVVWGTGGRGKVAAAIFGTERIAAFIDSNPEKIGNIFFEKPIIDFDTYKKDYTEYAILISMVEEKVVADMLKKEKIFFFSYNECPPELIGYGWKSARKYIDEIKLPKQKVAVYGYTLYSVLLYEYLEKSGYECAGLIYNTCLQEYEKVSFENKFPFIKVKNISDIDEATTILQTISAYDCEIKLHGFTVQNVYDWRKYIPDYYNHRIAALHDKYKGKRCFIVATGPSLTFEDLERLRINKEFCISVNSIFRCFNETRWRPNQYVVMDVDAINCFDNDIRKMDVEEKFIADASIDFNYDNLTDEFYVYHSICTKNTLQKGLVSEDFSRCVYNIGTVTATSIQLAMYEGFNEIYIIGCDCSYLYTGPQHFNEAESMQFKCYRTMETDVNVLNWHFNAYQKLREYAEKKGIKIYNATRGGYLEAFERVSFDDVL